MSMYFEAASIIKQIKSKKASLKNLVFNSKAKNKKALYALVCETLKFQEVFKSILNNVRLLEKEKTIKRDEDLAMVLLYDHILGRGVLGHFKECFMRHKSSIHSQCELLKIKHKVTDLRQLVKESPGKNFPKYVRVNTLKTTTNSVIQHFKDKGRTLNACTEDSFKESASELSSKTFMLDPHIPDLLVFETSTDFHKHPLYTSGEIILQDKASCFPAYILSPPPGSHVVDCCAAPGNKTSHLACIMQNKGKVFAFDKDKHRLGTLKTLTTKAGATCIEATCADFLEVNLSDKKYKQVEYILVDPSCSGSGMINRASQFTDETDSCSSERLQQLAKFQISILEHALSFPAVKRVVYSTCSIHEEENEQVVEEILSYCGDKFELLNLEPDWPIRGVKGYEHAQLCLRMSHDLCLTNGFFVACFQRKGFLKTVKDDIDVRTSEGKEKPFKVKENDVNGKHHHVTNNDIIGKHFVEYSQNTCKHKKKTGKKKRKQEAINEKAVDLTHVKKAKLTEHHDVPGYLTVVNDRNCFKVTNVDSAMNTKLDKLNTNKKSESIESTSSKSSHNNKQKKKKKRKAKQITT